MIALQIPAQRIAPRLPAVVAAVLLTMASTLALSAERCRDRICFEIEGMKFAVPDYLISFVSQAPPSQPKGDSDASINITVDDFLKRTTSIPLTLSEQRRASTLNIVVLQGLSGIEEKRDELLRTYPGGFQRIDDDTSFPNAVLYEARGLGTSSTVKQVVVPREASGTHFYECSRWRQRRPAIAEEDGACFARTYFDVEKPSLAVRLEYQIPRSVMSQDRMLWDRKVRVLLKSFRHNSHI